VWKQPPSPAFPWYDYWAFRFQIMPPIVYGADTTTKSVFVEDSWKLSDKLTLDIGVRYDDQEGVIPDFPRLDVDGNPTDEIIPGADMISWQNWAPRLGFAWQPKGDGRTVLRGFAGRFWDGPVSSAWYYPPPGRGNAEVYFVYPWQFLVSSQPAAPADELLAPGVKNPYTDQYGLSFDQQLGSDYAIGAQLMYKHTDDMIGWQIEDDGECLPFLWDDPWTEGVVEQIPLCETTVEPTRHKGNSPGPGSLAPDASYYIDYRGAVLTFKKRYTNGWDLMASYTYSKTEGINTRPHDNGSLGQGLPSFTTDSGSDPNDWYNAEHLLQGDRTHMFRVQSNVDVGWGLRLSGVLNIQSGRPYLRLAQVVGPTTGQALTITADASEELRLPNQAILDVGVQKGFDLGGGVDLDLGLQMLNVTNEDAVEYYSSWTLFQGQEFSPSSWVSPRRLQAKLQLTF
jgi:outer membrane receptor protein involved in Fe transport